MRAAIETKRVFGHAPTEFHSAPRSILESDGCLLRQVCGGFVPRLFERYSRCTLQFRAPFLVRPACVDAIRRLPVHWRGSCARKRACMRAQAPANLQQRAPGGHEVH